MREIKFRAWHKPTQLMDDVVLIDFYNEKIGILYADPVMQCESIRKYNFNEVELMQYTCLKDKNGVEIYEGDVFPHPGGIKYGKYRVTWDEDCAGFGWFNGDGTGFSAEEIEVIGNIYENPELLEKEE